MCTTASTLWVFQKRINIKWNVSCLCLLSNIDNSSEVWRVACAAAASHVLKLALVVLRAFEMFHYLWDAKCTIIICDSHAHVFMYMHACCINTNAFILSFHHTILRMHTCPHTHAVTWWWSEAVFCSHQSPAAAATSCLGPSCNRSVRNLLSERCSSVTLQHWGFFFWKTDATDYREELVCSSFRYHLTHNVIPRMAEVFYYLSRLSSLCVVSCLKGCSSPAPESVTAGGRGFCVHSQSCWLYDDHIKDIYCIKH